jgi:hypothetical protein
MVPLKQIEINWFKVSLSKDVWHGQVGTAHRALNPPHHSLQDEGGDTLRIVHCNLEDHGVEAVRGAKSPWELAGLQTCCGPEASCSLTAKLWFY